MYKILSNYERSVDHTYNMRTVQNVRNRDCRTVHTQKSISYLGPKIWNELPPDNKNAESVPCLERNFKRYLLSSYEFADV